MFHFLEPSFRRFRAGERGVALRVTNLWAMPSKSCNTLGFTRDRVIAGVVVRHVVNIGVRSEQLGAIIEIHAKYKRTGFGGAISRDTRQVFHGP